MLASVTVVAAMAVAGVSSAMAENTQLCKENSATLACPAGQAKTTLHFITVNEKGELGKAKLLSEAGTIECHVLISGEALALGNPQIAHVELHYSECNMGCSVPLEEGLLEILKVAAELANVTGINFLVELNCPFIFKCDYNASGLVGHGLGATVAGTNGLGHVTYSAKTVTLVQKLLGPFNCPTTSALHALFKSLPGEPIYIRS